MDFEDEEDIEMPTPCQHCGEIFDLNDGGASVKWYPNTVICSNCSKKEDIELEIENEIEDLENALADAEYTIKDSQERLSELRIKLSEL